MEFLSLWEELICTNQVRPGGKRPRKTNLDCSISWENNAFLCELGIREPLILRKPNSVPREVDGLVSLVDIVPTILEWHKVEIPSGLSGESLLQSGNEGNTIWKACIINHFEDNTDMFLLLGWEGRKVYGSQSFHEVTMTYPMRFVRTNRFKLIHNINYQLPFPIDQDFYLSSTFQVSFYNRMVLHTGLLFNMKRIVF